MKKEATWPTAPCLAAQPALAALTSGQTMADRRVCAHSEILYQHKRSAVEYEGRWFGSSEHEQEHQPETAETLV